MSDRTTPPVALTIAGSDSGGGAGIQADLQTFAALGVFGTSAVTAVTAQNTVGVQDVHVVPLSTVAHQIESVCSDLAPSSVKTGMLATAQLVGLVAERAASRLLPSLVVDPVMVASTGARLLDQDAERAYTDLLFPHALVVTPNLWEAGALLGAKVASISDMEAAARELGRTGPAWVVVKGGHLPGAEAVDVVWDGHEMRHLVEPWVDTPNVHGTGCTFSAAIAASLARGTDPAGAIVRAKRFVTRALRGASHWRLGAGTGPVDHLAVADEPGPARDAPGHV